MSAKAVIEGYVQRNLPGRAIDQVNLYVPARFGAYQEQMVQNVVPSKHNLADEGSYYVATNPTFETPIAVTTSITTYAETAGAVGVALLMRNTDSRSNPMAKRVYLDYIKLMIVQVPTSATAWKYGIAIDDNPVRYTSGGSAITTIFNVNGDVPNASVVQMYFGALTTAVPTNTRRVARGNLRGVIPTTFDEYVIACGAIEPSGAFASAAASGKGIDMCPPIIIAPQQNLALTMWGASNAAAPSFEFEVAWWER